ncbi:MAG TPA: protein translocase subunit SecF [Thermoanaerobaculia bacterium]|nr:protein translocase subunit SecF [Thermoanaerobaculia bacterium]
MQLLRDTNIDFMKYRRIWIAISVVGLILGIYAMVGPHKLNLGIDFAGGTQVTLAFREAPDVDRLRSLLDKAGLAAQIQPYGKLEDNQVIVKTAVAKGSEEGSRDRIVAALSGSFNQGKGGLDLNQTGIDALTEFLVQANPDRIAQGPAAARTHYSGIADRIVAERGRNGIFESWDRIAQVPGVSPALTAALQKGVLLGDFAVLGTDNVGPQVGKELRSQGFWAVVLSLLGMLSYIWIRFELRFGIGAIMASLHDVTVTLGLYTLLGYEYNLTTIAAFLTLIGYSVNDTVVIFDRIRENMRKSRRKPLMELLNESLNQTLSRTIITSGLTFLTVLSLLILGGDVLRGFAFIMTVGIIVGTYSTIYIAGPFAMLWESLFGPGGKWRREKPATAAGRPEPTRVEPKPGELPARRRPARRRA